MNASALVLAGVSSLLIACSSHPTAGFDPGVSGDDGGGGGSSSGTGSSGGSNGSVGSSSGGVSSSGAGSSGSGTSSGSGSSSGASDGGAKVDSGIAATQVGKSVTLTAQSFQVAAGAEVYKCEVFANPFGGAADLIRLHGTMSAGSHHFFLFNISSANAAVEPKESPGSLNTLGSCAGNGIEFHPFPFLSQQPDWTVTFPKASDGSPMGYPLQASSLLMINVHYLNTSSSPITPTVTITVDAAAPGVVSTHVGTLFLNQNPMNIPVTPMSSPVLSTKSWAGNPGAVSADGSYNIFTSWSHMHHWGLDIQASTNNQVFYDETNWDSPGLFYHGTPPAGASNPVTAHGASSPVHMTQSQGITWSCSYYNDTGATLTFGDSAVSSVMCIYMGQYYPADANNPDVIDVVN
jgi:hypothetical protein